METSGTLESVGSLRIFPREQAETHRLMLYYLRHMKYDDALVCSRLNWRLEYRRPDEGEDHYLLIQCGEPVGLQYVNAKSWLNEVQVKLAVYLALIGFKAENTDFRAGGAEIPLSFGHNRLPHLVEMEYWHKQKEIISDTQHMTEALEAIRVITQKTLPSVLTPTDHNRPMYELLKQVDLGASALLVAERNAEQVTLDEDEEDYGGYS